MKARTSINDVNPALSRWRIALKVMIYFSCSQANRCFVLVFSQGSRQYTNIHPQSIGLGGRSIVRLNRRTRIETKLDARELFIRQGIVRLNRRT
ncbi:MAG: hypothetical protein PF483_13235, partial [Halothiobacillus sp.]|nr:hypothetical protein [Halothiobacillus sp.]